MQSRIVCLVTALGLIATTAQAKHLHKEAEYRDAWCQGETEVRLPNGNRADCITDKYAVEIDFAAKYHEAIGQALDYADQAGKRPAILLIVEKEKEWRYVKKARVIAKKHRIKIWIIRPEQI